MAVLLVGSMLGAFSFGISARTLAVQPAVPRVQQLSQVFTPEVQYWRSSILRWASASGLDPNLLAVIMQIESCGDPAARSAAGAAGLFQVMPDHFLATEDPFSPDTNAARATDYLGRSLAAADNDIPEAFAGYNGGISLIPGSDWPAETVRYVYWGSGIYADANGGAAHSSRLSEWLMAGGASLCREARLRLGIKD
jgi:soluble lytic murein transglycosylase-like protein